MVISWIYNMVLYQFTTVKSVLGETGTSNDSKIRHYGEMADKAIISDLLNVKDLPNPPVVTTDVLTQEELDNIKSFATQYTVGYFYKFESGDEQTIAEAKENWKTWFNNKFRRFTFKARGGETAR
jgi:hypothetical protein